MFRKCKRETVSDKDYEEYNDILSQMEKSAICGYMHPSTDKL